MWGQYRIDVRAAERERNIAAQQRQADDLRAEERRLDDIRLENVRFIREQAADPARLDADMEDLPFLPYANMDLKGMTLAGLDMRNADFFGANLSKAFLYEAAVQGADFSSADLRGAVFFRAHVEGAIMKDAQLAGAVLDGIDGNPRWFRADLRGADLRGLTSAPEEMVCYDSSTRWPAGHVLPENYC